ncbi:MAG: zinc ribbon domain-containing protein [Dehalococcoidia bacterium]|nr:MAG: zinc ribbon domain-containing protein [Dehalococcoidia bacterium]
MPIYDYRCRECGRVSEVFVRTSTGEVRCPHCGGEDMERLVSASYMIRMDVAATDTTCCGRTERCETPPCSSGDVCRRR